MFIDTCQMCHSAPEIVPHLVALCPALKETRSNHIYRILDLIQACCGSEARQRIETNPDAVTQVAIDISSTSLILTDPARKELEKLTRQLLYALHQKRAVLLGLRAIAGDSRR